MFKHSALMRAAGRDDIVGLLARMTAKFKELNRGRVLFDPGFTIVWDSLPTGTPPAGTPAAAHSKHSPE